MRALWIYLLGRMFAVLGRQIFSVAVGWDLYERTNSVIALGLVGLVQVVPVLLLSVLAGNVVDRLDARRVAFVSVLGAAVCAMCFAAASALLLPVWVAYVLLALHAVCIAFVSPSIATIVPRLVGPEHRARANTYSATTFEIASIVGPAAAGALIALTRTATIAYATHAVGTVLFAGVLQWLILRGHAQKEGAPQRARTFADMTVGFSYVFRSKLLLPAMTLDLFAMLLGGATALLPVFAKDVLRVGPEGLGLLRAAPSIGALLMAIISTRLRPWRRPGVALLYSVAGFGLATIGFALSPNMAAALVFLALSGACDNISVVIRLTLEQMLTPDALRGRVSAVHYVFIGMSNELGELESGLTAALLGPIGSVLFGGVGTLFIVAWIRTQWPELWRIKPLKELTPDGSNST
ncbi:MAG: MFS transporter [Deltaproteobacteria bacterium]|nr:MFS transporter [Deltaproteobacteria bacterium]